MSPEEKELRISLNLKLAEWKLLVHELRQSEQLAARYGNRKMRETLHDIRKTIEFHADYETDN